MGITEGIERDRDRDTSDKDSKDGLELKDSPPTKDKYLADQKKKKDYNKLFDLIWTVLRNPSYGYPEATLVRLRMLNQKMLF